MKVNKFFVLSLLFTFVFVCVFAVDGVSNAKAAEQGELVAHYTFDGDLQDSSGKGNHGRAVGNITFEDGKLGKGAKFDGVSFIKVEDSNSLDLTDGFTFALWVYREEYVSGHPYAPILSKSDDGVQPYSLQLAYAYRRPAVCLRDESSGSSQEFSPDIVIGSQNWTHLVVTWDGNELMYYKNGAFVGVEQTENINCLHCNDEDLLIGKYISNQTAVFNGMMDDLRIYNYALSASDISELAKAKPPTAQPETTTDTAQSVAVPDGLVAYYPFEDNCDDLSGKNNHGSAIGNITFANGKLGKGVKFDGVSFIKVEDSNSLDLTDAFSFALWVNREEIVSGAPYTPILSKGDDGILPYRLQLAYGYRKPGVCLRDESSGSSREFSSDIVVDIQNWTHLVVTWDGNELWYYKNGAFEGMEETKNINCLHCNDQNLLIGKYVGNSTVVFKGMMDELRIYNRALTNEEIKLLYEAKLVPIKTDIQQTPRQLRDIKPVSLVAPENPKTTIILQLDNPKMYVNGVETDIDPGYGTKPITVNGRTILPIRAIMESLGGTVGWVQDEQKITIDVSDTNITMWVGRQDYYVNGVMQTLEVAPVVVNSRTLLPLRAILENIGYIVEWNNEFRAVIIVSQN